MSEIFSPRSGSTRNPIERIFLIHQLVRRGKFPNCRTLAEEVGVTQKTIQRDINYMRTDLNLPIEYDQRNHGYHYTEPVEDFPQLNITVEDLVTLFLARQALASLEGSPLEATLRDSFRRLSSSLRGEVTFRWSDLDEAFSVKSAVGSIPADVKLFEKVGRAMLECCVIRFDYRKLEAEDWEPRKVRPFHLAEFDGGWYLIGYDEHRRAKRTFALQRIKAAKVLKTKFARPTDFDLSEHLGTSFGVWQDDDAGKETHRIHLRFAGWAARVVSERRWHPSQQIRWLGEGEEELEMILELSRFEEISRWILSWGAQVEVVAPGELRRQVADEIEDLMAVYDR